MREASILVVVWCGFMLPHVFVVLVSRSEGGSSMSGAHGEMSSRGMGRGGIMGKGLQVNGLGAYPSIMFSLKIY